ncbi:hypothetical protein LSCM4_02466 [Leishmania orientalis]|uniref:Uncharacterized protein n=1 Tax=Leishmania orientalis TaxID=2249476 RepID=A0A836KFP5_9TRYP|nr:hypothetical protein LSCM4_02466 [Leishmania orientalis]
MKMLKGYAFLENPGCSPAGVTAPSYAVSAPHARGQLPPGRERRMSLSTTLYLNSILLEAHKQVPWAAWWGRADNADPGSVKRG